MYVMQQHLATYLRLRGRKRGLRNRRREALRLAIKLTENKDNNQ